MTRTWLIFFWITIPLMGCATERWVQEGKTSDEIAAAVVECEQSMFPKPTPLSDPTATLPDQSFIVKCMKDKGYKLGRE